MKKSDIVERVAGVTGVTKRAAEGAVGAVFAAIAEAPAHGENVTVAGFREVLPEEPACPPGQEPAHWRAGRDRPVEYGVVPGRARR